MTSQYIIDETSSASSDGQLDGQDSSDGGVRLLARTNRTAFQIERNLVLDRMFGEEGPRRSVVSPAELKVDISSFDEDFGAGSVDPHSPIRADHAAQGLQTKSRGIVDDIVDAVAQWDDVQCQATDLACRVTGHASPPTTFVSALWQQHYQLWFAIQHAAYPRARAADLRLRTKALGRAAKLIGRALDGGRISKKNTAEQAGQLRWSINTLRHLFGEKAAFSESASPRPSEIFNFFLRRLRSIAFRLPFGAMMAKFLSA
jgi:hypothetical protein